MFLDGLLMKTSARHFSRGNWAQLGLWCPSAGLTTRRVDAYDVAHFRGAQLVYNVAPAGGTPSIVSISGTKSQRGSVGPVTSSQLLCVRRLAGFRVGRDERRD
jgi:hypothetical protein